MTASVIKWLIGIVIAAMLFPGWAAAWYQNPRNGMYAFAGHTFKDGTYEARVPKDPINILFNGNDQVVNVTGMLETWGAMKHRHWQYGDCISKQNLQLRFPSSTDGDDRQFATQKCMQDRYHMRMWDSLEWDQAHDEAPQDRWAVAGIHYDDYGPFPKGDNIAQPWEIAEDRLRVELGGKYCTWKDLRHLPGSGGGFQGYYSDGKYTRISPETHNQPGDGHCHFGNG